MVAQRSAALIIFHLISSSRVPGINAFSLIPGSCRRSHAQFRPGTKPALRGWVPSTAPPLERLCHPVRISLHKAVFEKASRAAETSTRGMAHDPKCSQFSLVWDRRCVFTPEALYIPCWICFLPLIIMLPDGHEWLKAVSQLQLCASMTWLIKWLWTVHSPVLSASRAPLLFLQVDGTPSPPLLDIVMVTPGSKIFQELSHTLL